MADLKSRRVGFAKAAGVHYLLIAALEQAGLGFRDIDPAYLSPADGRAAFERGAIDAWVVWDPFLSAARAQSGARILRDGEGKTEGGRVEGFAGGHEGDGAAGDFRGEGGHGGVLCAVEDEIAVDFIRADENIVAQTDFGDAFQIRA